MARMISRVLVSVTVALSGWAARPTPAYADWPYHLVETECLSQIEYFSIRTHRLYNLDLTDETRAAMSARGLYDLSDAAGRTFRCEVAGREITAEIQRAPPRERGECAALERGMMTLRVDGRAVYENNDTHAGCHDSVELTIRADRFGIVVCETHFTVIDGEQTPTQTQCVTPFKPAN
jgi:hypothetical protein